VSDTPRTDAAEWAGDLRFPDGIYSDWVVRSKFARELERENVALRGKVEQLERAILRYAHIEETLASTVRGLEFELEKANAALDLLNTHCMSADPIMGRSTYRWTIEHDEPDIRAFIDELRKVTRA
jgi:predicted MarR family transcription regulator